MVTHSNNSSSADDQQERLEVGWIVGFTDGEGCFSVSLIRNVTTRFGKQVFPEFVITQGAKSLPALRTVMDFFACGSIILNKRYDNHKEDLYRYCVRSVRDLHERIIPFFEKHALRTNKCNDFKIFKEIVSMMFQKKHLTEKGLKRITTLAGRMNRKKNRF